MKKLFFMLLIITSFSQSIFCAHESSKDLKKKSTKNDNEKFKSNTIEFYDFFNFVKEKVTDVIQTGTLSHYIDNLSQMETFTGNQQTTKIINTVYTKNENEITFSTLYEKINIMLSGNVETLPTSLQAVPVDSKKEFTLNLKKPLSATINSKFNKKRDRFSIIVNIDYDREFPINSHKLYELLDVIIKESAKNIRSAKEAEAKRAADQQTLSASSASIPTSATTATTSTTEPRSTRTINNKSSVEGEVEMGIAPEPTISSANNSDSQETITDDTRDAARALLDLSKRTEK